MFSKIKSFVFVPLIIFASVFGGIGLDPQPAFASESFALSPMYDMVTLTPGEVFESSFVIVNPAGNTSNFYYQLRIDPFTQNGDQITTAENGHYTDMKDWIELSKTEGVVAPNSSETVPYRIYVPLDAPAGGQYASISVSSKEDTAAEQGGLNIHEVFEMGYLIYAEVAGETVRKGNITNVDVPGFLFSGNIAGSASITNEGNVHSAFTQTLQIFPLFSKEEVFTNEENPKEGWVMPGNTNYASVTWTETPSVGIFHVIYNVEYEGVESKVDKIVIVCPLWLLFLILLAIFLIIFRILSVKKKSKE